MIERERENQVEKEYRRQYMLIILLLSRFAFQCSSRASSGNVFRLNSEEGD